MMQPLEIHTRVFQPGFDEGTLLPLALMTLIKEAIDSGVGITTDRYGQIDRTGIGPRYFEPEPIGIGVLVATARILLRTEAK